MLAVRCCVSRIASSSATRVSKLSIFSYIFKIMKENYLQMQNKESDVPHTTAVFYYESSKQSLGLVT